MKNLFEKSKSKALLKLGQVTVVLSHSYRKAMLAYCKLEDRDKRSNVLMDFIRRIEANSSAIRQLAAASIEENNSSHYFKLPIGLLLRSCVLDSLQGLYLSSLTAESANQMIVGFDQDYVCSLPSRFEVYSDRFSDDEEDEELRNCYGLQIEDVFTSYVDFSSHKDGYFKIRNTSRPLTARGMYQALKVNPDFEKLSKRLYAYFRTYSQYEHFSIMGHGDSLVPFDEDMPYISKPYDYITEAVIHILKATAFSPVLLPWAQMAYENVVSINAA